MFRPPFDVRKRGGGAAERKFEIAAVENFAVGEVFVLIGAVRFQPVRLFAHGGARKSRAGAERSRGIEGRAEQHDARVAPVTVAA